jgi:preprotein translocase subunit SecD
VPRHSYALTLFLAYLWPDSKDRALKIISSELSDLVVLESNNKDELSIHLVISDSAKRDAKKNALKQNITTLRNRVHL